MMLGLNEITSGDATDSFSEYDSDRNYEFRRSYYDQWGLEYDPQEMRQMLRYLESFPCTRSRRAGEARRVVAGTR